MDREANAAFYNDPGMTPERIFASSPNIAPDAANTFVQLLTAQTTRLPRQPGMQAVPDIPAPVEEESSEVRTYGIPDPEEAE